MVGLFEHDCARSVATTPPFYNSFRPLFFSFFPNRVAAAKYQLVGMYSELGGSAWGNMRRW